ncbi:MAG: nucleotidyltransferase family protein [Bacteroidota bacterium]|nr:nucleotidyltransferase family protein [Bacteroidota bacterium]
MNKLSIITRLKDIKPALCDTYGITELALFGSYSRDEATEKSDIDIMIDYHAPMGMRFFDIVYELEEVFKNKKVQVITRKAIKPKYFDRIKQDLIYA